MRLHGVLVGVPKGTKLHRVTKNLNTRILPLLLGVNLGHTLNPHLTRPFRLRLTGKEKTIVHDWQWMLLLVDPCLVPSARIQEPQSTLVARRLQEVCQDTLGTLPRLLQLGQVFLRSTLFQLPLPRSQDRMAHPLMNRLSSFLHYLQYPP